MGNLDIDSLFTNIFLEETMKICTNDLFKNNVIVQVLKKKVNLKTSTSATKESHFIFNNILYKQKDGVVMGSSLGPSLANAFLAYHEQNLSDKCPLEYRSLYYWRYVDDIFVLFKSCDPLK